MLYKGIRPNLRNKDWLWDSLQKEAAEHSLPWLVTGDFNEVGSQSEKYGGQVNHLRCYKFNSVLNACNLIDLGFKGPRYTWTNCRHGPNLIKERLDRTLANPHWKSLFPEAVVSHLPRTRSDHCLMLIELEGLPSPLPSLLVELLDSHRLILLSRWVIRFTESEAFPR